MVEFVTPIIEPTRRYYSNTIRNNNSSNNSNESISGSRSCIVNDGDNDEHHRMLSPGERIQLYLGSSGLCYHIILNHNDGITQWQTQASTSSLSSSSGCDDIPPSLVRQFYNMRYKNRYVTHFAINQTINGNEETYFVRGCDGNGTNDYYWSDIPRIGSGAASSHDMIPRLVALGMETTIIVYENKKILQLGYHIERLWDRMKRVKENGGIIYCLRLYQHFHNDCYFIRDSEGCEWNMFHTIPNHTILLNDLNNKKNWNNNNDLIDIIIAMDGSWIILRKTSYMVSDNIANDIMYLLREFYCHQKDYANNQQEKYIEEYKTKWERVNNTIVEQRQLSEGSCVTIVGKSCRFGDANIVTTFPAIWVRFIHSSAENLIRIDDAATILPFDNNINTSTSDTSSSNSSSSSSSGSSSNTFDEQEVATYAPKYEDATQSVSRCLYNNQPSDHGRLVRTGDDYCSVIIQDRNSDISSNNNNTKITIDPYMCIEKIDTSRLLRLHIDLLSDSKAREKLFYKMTQYGTRYSEQVKVLKRCKGIEKLVLKLVKMVDETNHSTKCPTDGCWIYPVKYETKDPLFPGRLFAIGQTATTKTTSEVTVQGMHSELRPPFLGLFGYDIDCAKSDVRILCSLATQLNVEHLIPTLFEYRDNHMFDIQIIQNDHKQPHRDVTIDEAKRLSTIIIGGGSYNAWLKANKLKKLNPPEQGDSMTEQFAFNLQTEVRALELFLMNEHKRFPWMTKVRQNLVEESMSDDGRNNDSNRTGQIIDRVLLSRIIHVCENEILTLMHQHITDLGWIVRTKIFDGLIIEPSTTTKVSSLKECLQSTEQYCKSHGGWDIKLVEKPLHGLQDEPIPSLVQARSYLTEFQSLWNDKK